MPWRLLTVLSLVTFSLCAAQILGPLGGIAHVQDEQAYLLQARIFAGLQRTLEPPGDLLLRWSEFQELEPRWYGVFPPGWPLVLALGVRAGAAWAVGPLLAAALPWACWLALRPSLEARAASVAATLAALSPGLLLLGGSWMSHTLALLCATLAVAGVERRSALAGGAGGLALGLLACTRPWDAVLVGAPLGALALVRTARGERGAAWLLALVLGGAGPVGLLLWDNLRLTGEAWTFPVDAYFRDGTDWGQAFREGCNRLGFGPDRGCAWYLEETGTDLAWTWKNITQNATFFDRLFLGFGGSALLIVAGLPALWRRAPALAVTALTVPLGYGLYWYHGICYGARFWSSAHLAALPAAALTLTALERLLHLRPSLARLAPTLLPLLVVAGLLNTLPSAWSELRDRYWCVDAGLDERLQAIGIDSGVILLRDTGTYTARWPLLKQGAITCDANLSPGTGLTLNDPLHPGPTLYLRWPGFSQTSELRALYPDRPLYLLERHLPSGAAHLLPYDETMAGWGPRLPIP